MAILLDKVSSLDEPKTLTRKSNVESLPRGREHEHHLATTLTPSFGGAQPRVIACFSTEATATAHRYLTLALPLRLDIIHVRAWNGSTMMTSSSTWLPKGGKLVYWPRRDDPDHWLGTLLGHLL